MSDPVLLCEEFLAPVEEDYLRRFAIDREPDFIGSELTSDDDSGRRDEDFRRSRVLYDVAPVAPILTERVLDHLPWVLDRLDQANFAVREVELQITASNDGEWFKAHRDSGAGTVSSRELTFVYYCHREPRPFAGGELRMFGAFESGDDPTAALTIVPPPNSIVFFPSHFLHEVMPVSCPSRQFIDSRFTYNGWLHR